MVGINTILKTTNGGIDWIDISPGIDLILSSLYFFDQHTGYAAGYDYTTFTDVILQTIDGGQTWSSYHLASQSGLRGIHFADYNNGFAVGTGAAYRTTDGGESWSQMLVVGNLELYSVFMSSSNIGFIAADRGKLFKTSDGGNSWVESSAGTLNPFKSIFFTDQETGYTVGLNGNIFKTTNSGGINVIQDAFIARSNFNLYPNPATTKIILNNTSEFVGETNVIIFSTQGRQLFNHTFTTQEYFELDVSILSTGIYLLEIQNNAGVETKKLVIQ